MSNTTDIEVREDDQLMKAVVPLIESYDEDPEKAAIEITNRILTATSVDEVLAPRGTVHARDVLGETLLLRGVRWQKSDFEDGPEVYAVLDADLVRTGEQVVITCGARNVMASALKLVTLDALPIEVVIRESEKATDRGFKPMWLEKPEPPL